MSKPLDLVPTPAARTAAHRAARKAAGHPEPRIVDRAMAEGLAFLLRLQTPVPPSIDIAELHRAALIALVRDGYDRKLSKAAIVERLRPRAEHGMHNYMPSIRPHNDDAMIMTPKNGSWSTKDLGFVREVITRAFGRLRTP